MGPAVLLRLEVRPGPVGLDYSSDIRLPTFLNLIPALLIGAALVVILVVLPWPPEFVAYYRVELARWRNVV